MERDINVVGNTCPGGGGVIRVWHVVTRVSAEPFALIQSKFGFGAGPSVTPSNVLRISETRSVGGRRSLLNVKTTAVCKFILGNRRVARSNN